MTLAPVTGLCDPGRGLPPHFGPGTGLRRGFARRRRQVEQRHERVVGPRPGVVPGQQPHQPVQVAVERGVQVHLHAQVFDHRHALGPRDAFGHLAQQGDVDAAGLGAVGHRDALQDLGHTGVAGRVLGQPLLGDQPFLDQDRCQRGQAPRIGARAHGEVVVRHLGGLAAARVDDDHRAFGSFWISRRITRVRAKPCDWNGFLPRKTETSACSKSPCTPAPIILPCTQASPVFSCARALER